jgi:hypothetical protein
VQFSKRFVTPALLLLTVMTAEVLSAGPVDFGVAEYKAALAERKLRWKIAYEVTPDPPESYRIEPYKYGGAHVTGGDLRGLMYGLLEAAGQIRATGRLKQVHAAPAALIRGTRMFADDAKFTPERWRAYFEMLARDRFNRFTLIYTEPPQDMQVLREVSQAAAEFGVDFTLALWEHEPDAALGKILAMCPLIRTVQIRNTTHDLETYRGLVFKPLHSAGRRVALDPEPEFVEAAHEAGIALRNDPPSWPPGFDIDGPRDFEQHALFYYVFGRTAYDPKAVPPSGQPPVEFAAAARAAMLVTSSDAQSNDWVASIAEAAKNAAEGIPSAKRTPADLIGEMRAQSAALAKSTFPDFQLLAKMAGERAEKLQASLDSESGGVRPSASKPVPRPVIHHTPLKSAPIDQPITLTLEINPYKTATFVRLHYRANGAKETQTVEKPAGPLVSFTIPGTDADLIYYFEILNQEKTGWFEPDPFTTAPYYSIRIEPKPPVQ